MTLPAILPKNRVVLLEWMNDTQRAMDDLSSKSEGIEKAHNRLVVMYDNMGMIARFLYGHKVLLTGQLLLKDVLKNEQEIMDLLADMLRLRKALKALPPEGQDNG